MHKCPAKERKGNNCGHKGHFKKMCHAQPRRQVNDINTHSDDEYDVNLDELFIDGIDTVKGKNCFADLSIEGLKVKVKLDTSITDPDPDLHQNLILSALSHTQSAHQISSRSAHNVFEIS